MRNPLLSDVTILVTTFYRPGFLHECMKDLRANLPECEVAISCDDGGWTKNKYVPNDRWVELPFDTGLTAKRNACVSITKTKYALLGSDDYNFQPTWVRTGIERMIATLDAHPDIDVVVGTYNGMRYEGTLEHIPGEYIMEHRIKLSHPVLYEFPYPCKKIEMGINYFLARTQVLRDVPWDERVRPIGGEHGDWFMDMKVAGKCIVFVDECCIENKPASKCPDFVHKDYIKYRRRAQMGHDAMLKKWGIKEYYSYNQGPRG